MKEKRAAFPSPDLAVLQLHSKKRTEQIIKWEPGKRSEHLSYEVRGYKQLRVNQELLRVCKRGAAALTGPT